MSSFQEGVAAPLTSDRIAPFFEQVYQNYNLIWQEIIKLPSLEADFVPFESFSQVLCSSGIDINDPYCMFLLDTSCQWLPNQSSSNGKQSKISSQSQEKLIDFKLFLNTAIKEKINNFERPFSDESFIIDHFWRAKFYQQSTASGQQNQGRGHSPDITVNFPRMPTFSSKPEQNQARPKSHKIPIDTFNQAFYQFFNRATKLLQIDQIELILNECFQYLLKKNKKSISKRNFRIVISRHFKFLFPMIIHQYHQLAQDRMIEASQLQSLGRKFSIDQIMPRETNGSHQAQAHDFPRLCEHHQSVYQTSTFKQCEENISEPQSISTQRIDGVFKLFQSLERAQIRIKESKVLRAIKRFIKNKEKYCQREQLMDLENKENQRPYDNYGQHNNRIVNSSKQSRHKNRNPLSLNQQQETQFSFNNNSSGAKNRNTEEYAFLKETTPSAYHLQQRLLSQQENIALNYQSHCLLQRYDPYQDEPFVQLARHQSLKDSKQHSIGSLAISATSVKDPNTQNCFVNISPVRDPQLYQHPYVNQQSYHQLPVPVNNKLQRGSEHNLKPPLDYTKVSNNGTHFYQAKDSQRCSNESTTMISAVEHNNSSHLIADSSRYPPQEEMNSIYSNGTISTRRNQMPPISSSRRPQKRHTSKRKKSEPKYSSTPKIMVFGSQSQQNNSLVQAEECQYNSMIYPQPSSTIDYSLPNSSSRLQQQLNQQCPNNNGRQRARTKSREDNNRRRRESREFSCQSYQEGFQDKIARDVFYYQRKYRYMRQRVKRLISVDKERSHQTAKALKRTLKVHQSHKNRANLKSILQQWYMQSHIRTNILQMKLQIALFKQKNRLFQAWKNLKLTGAQQLLSNLRAKTLIKVLNNSKKEKLSKRKVFNQWRKQIALFASQQLNKKFLSQVQIDMKQANQQMRVMRIILGITQLSKIVEGQNKVNKMKALCKIATFKQGALLLRNNKLLINKDHSQILNKRNDDSMTQWKNQRMNLSSGIIDEFTFKASKQRSLARIIDGIEKLYNLIKKKEQLKRKTRFQRWRYLTYDALVDQLDMSNDPALNNWNFNRLQNFQAAAFHPLQQQQQRVRASSLNQPSFYKTNEGYFSADQQDIGRKMQSTTIVFSPSPKGKGCQISVNHHHSDDGESINNMTQLMEIPMAPPQPHPLMNTISYISSRSRSNGRSVKEERPLSPFTPSQVMRQPYHQPNNNYNNRTLKGFLDNTITVSHKRKHSSQSAKKPTGPPQSCELIISDQTQLNEAVAYLKAKLASKKSPAFNHRR